MYHSNDANHSDIFICDANDGLWHDRYFQRPSTSELPAPICQIHRMGVETCLPKLFCIKRTAKNNAYGIVMCVHTGMGKLCFEGQDYALMPGTLLLLPSGVAHSYQSDANNPMGVVWCEFNGGDSLTLLSKIVCNTGPLMHGRICEKASRSICDILDNALLSNEDQSAVPLYALLVALWQHSQSHKEFVPSPNPKRGMPVIEAYISAQIGYPIENSTLAQKCGVSVQYFLRIFKENYGMSPQAYIRQKRISLSKVALSQSELSVQQIAEELGFCNTSHFIRRFKQQTGETPQGYRQKNRAQYDAMYSMKNKT